MKAEIQFATRYLPFAIQTRVQTERSGEGDILKVVVKALTVFFEKLLS